MVDSTDTVARISKHYDSLYEMHRSSSFLQGSEDVASDPYPVKSDPPGQNDEDMKYIAQIQEPGGAEDAKQTFRNSVEIGRLERKTFDVNISPVRE